MPMRPIVMLVQMFMEEGGPKEKADNEKSKRCLLYLMEALTRCNQEYLHVHPETPKLYNSGVVYQPEFGTEEWQDIPTTLERRWGDCFPLTQKIIVRSLSTGMYELLSLGELRFVYPHYEALSYNFSKCCQEFKPITAFFDKGEKSVLKARLSNGTDLVATEDHKFWTIDGRCENPRGLKARTMGEYLEASKASKSYRTDHSRILQASQIPALESVRAPSKAEAYLAGIFAAEGDCDGSHVRIAQHKEPIRRKIEASFAELGAEFSYREGGKYGGSAGSGACYSVLGGRENPLVAMMKGQGRNSFEVRLPPKFLSSDAQTVSTMLEGHADGDAYHPGARRKNIDAIYATSSDELKEQIKLGSLILGRHVYAYHQMEHQGAGKSPIWRLYEYNAKAEKIRSRQTRGDMRGLPSMTYGTIRNIERSGKAHVGCIEVEGNHNFFLADGTLAFNCEDLACWLTAELREKGIPAMPYIRWRQVHDSYRFHALVQLPPRNAETGEYAEFRDGRWVAPSTGQIVEGEGTLEDPSKKLGMTEWAPYLSSEESTK